MGQDPLSGVIELGPGVKIKKIKEGVGRAQHDRNTRDKRNIVLEWTIHSDKLACAWISSILSVQSGAMGNLVAIEHIKNRENEHMIMCCLTMRCYLGRGGPPM